MTGNMASLFLVCGIIFHGAANMITACFMYKSHILFSCKIFYNFPYSFAEGIRYNTKTKLYTNTYKHVCWNSDCTALTFGVNNTLGVIKHFGILIKRCKRYFSYIPGTWSDVQTHLFQFRLLIFVYPATLQE